MLKIKTQKSFPNCFLSEAKCAVQGDERNQVHMRIAIHEQWLLELVLYLSIQLDKRNQVHMRIAIHEQWLLELTSHHTVSLDERNQVHTMTGIPEQHI